MTVQEAKQRARKAILGSVMGCADNPNGLEDGIAAALIRAQIEAYLEAVAIADHSDNPGGDILWKQRECESALAKLEGRDDRNSNH